MKVRVEKLRGWAKEHYTRRGITWERAEAMRELTDRWERSGLLPQPPATYGELAVQTASGHQAVFSVTGIRLARDPAPGRIFFTATRRAGRRPLTVRDGAPCWLSAPDGSLVLQAYLRLGGDFTAHGSETGPGLFTFDLPAELELSTRVPIPREELAKLERSEPTA